MTKTVVILSGGTGGHVLPSVYFGNHLIEKGYNCILVTDKRGSQYTDQFLGRIKIISASHLTGNLFFKMQGIIKLFFGFFQSFFILLNLKPRIVISFGSYASLPPSVAVQLINVFCNIKFFIHEQNSVIGKTNKFLLKYAEILFVNYKKNYNLKKGHSNKIQIVGLPTSPNIKESNYQSSKYSDKNFTIFLSGGSQGSLAILSCFEKILSEFSSKELNEIFFIIQCPKKHINNFKTKISKFKINCHVKDFFYNLPEILNNTDLIISRCGAGSINDIILFKIPSILIPLPSAKDNHQYENALFISKKECGILMDQNNFDLKKASNYIKVIIQERDKNNIIIDKLKKIKILNTNELMLNFIKNEITK